MTFRAETFGELWLPQEFAFPCEIHHCWHRSFAEPDRFRVLVHHTEPSQLKASNREVESFHEFFNLIVTNESSLLFLPNAQFCAFGGKWIDDVPQCKRYEVSFLYSRGIGHEQHFKGYADRRTVCEAVKEREWADGYRLPTEAEWEWAARGGVNSKGYTYSGSDVVEEVAWIRGNSGGGAKAVDRKKANELGLSDMSGNVWEWVWDLPTGTSFRRLRGGSWIDYADVSNRGFYDHPGYRYNSFGFRVAFSSGQ